MSVYKRECADCLHCHDDYCGLYGMEIIVGRMNIADTCPYFKKKEGGA